MDKDPKEYEMKLLSSLVKVFPDKEPCLRSSATALLP